MTDLDITSERIKIDEPLWDLNSFSGRFRHYLWVTDPRTVSTSRIKLNEAKHLVEKYRLGLEPPGTTREQLIHAKKLFESSFHPDSGEDQNVFGRMSFQVPGGMAITGAMLAFYKSNTAVIFWQWINQSFNALVNYTNRNAQSNITNKKITIAYVSATTSAVITALGLKHVLAKRASPIMQRFVPFAAVAAANCVNIPLMRQSEATDGVAVFDENGRKVGTSQLAAVKGISQVVLSRIVIAAPGMLICPLIMDRLERMRWLRRMPYLNAPLQTGIVGMFLLFMVPVGCSLFSQRASIDMSTLKRWEPTSYSSIEQGLESSNVPERLYFNKDYNIDHLYELFWLIIH